MLTLTTEATQVRQFATALSEVPHARHFVTDLLAGHPCADDAAIVVSELAANAVQHSGAAGSGVFTVSLAHADGAVRIEVGNTTGPERPTVGRNDPQATGGRGLLIVDSLSRRWGVVRDGTQTRVWCEIGRTPPDPAPAVQVNA
ncbi:ATP-binding protein [Nonomuraea sp. NPDC050404]|uniref:ATP-binding protein n=1 Tax=Nonomuraea sp. NPDC050404 TaxID=3155783 RepID=UPI0033C9A83C